MSHFTVLVLLPDNFTKQFVMGVLDGVREEVDKVMGPFSENLEMDRYETPCWCIGRVSESVAMGTVEAIYPVDELRRRFHSSPLGIQASEIEYGKSTLPVEEHSRILREAKAMWREMAAPRDGMYDVVLKAHPMKDLPSPTCETCTGTGVRTTTSNPNGKWDWFRIGGRWDGILTGRDVVSSDNGFNFHKRHDGVDGNACLVRDIAKNKDGSRMIPFAIIDLNGQWHQKGDMGFFAIVHNENDCWEDTAGEILDMYRNSLAVLLDCHT